MKLVPAFIEGQWQEYALACAAFGMTPEEIATVRPTFFAGALAVAYVIQGGVDVALIIKEGESELAVASASVSSYSDTRN